MVPGLYHGVFTMVNFQTKKISLKGRSRTLAIASIVLTLQSAFLSVSNFEIIVREIPAFFESSSCVRPAASRHSLTLF